MSEGYGYAYFGSATIEEIFSPANWLDWQDADRSRRGRCQLFTSGRGVFWTGRRIWLRQKHPVSDSSSFVYADHWNSSFHGSESIHSSKREARENSKNIQMVFQDPFWSINPKMKIGAIIEEPLLTHMRFSKTEREQKVRELLEQVGLPADFTGRFPHQLSDGQLQRDGVARAIELKHATEKLKIINVVNVIDSVGYGKADVKRFASSGRIMRFNRHAFFTERIKNQHIFKIPELPKAYIFVSDEFRKRALKAELAGFQFIETWDSNDI
ncbi:UNVERIFIED_CONTAM: hypothetical protein ABID98_001887 [Brevibacillus sp. OAP136]